MREFIGHVLKVIADNFPGPVEGVMVDDRPSMILLKGKDGKITRIVKSHISGFQPMDFEPFKYVPLHIVYCANARQGCPGVQYIKEGAGVSVGDFELIMSPCPNRDEHCKCGTMGELRTANGELLRKMLAGTIYGDYPAKKGGKNANSSQDVGPQNK